MAYVAQLEALEKQITTLEKIVKRHMNGLRRRFYLECVYVGITYLIFLAGIIFSNVEGRVVAFALTGTSSVRIVQTSKTVIEGYLSDVEEWEKPIEGLRSLVSDADAKNAMEIKDLKDRLKLFKEKLLYASNLPKKEPI